MELNKIHNVDCLEFMKTLPDKCIDLILTDPPYGMSYQSSRRIATKKFDKIALDDDISWFPDFIKQCYRVLKDDSHIYIFCNDFAISEFRNLAKEAGFIPKRALVWIKNNHTSGDLEGDYANKTEFVVYAQKGRKKLNGGRDTNFLFFDRVANLEHPTEKPVDLCAYLVGKSSNENDIVFDPFCGGGSTLIASKKLDRNFIGCEISPEYCKIAQERIDAISNTLF